MSKHEEDAVTAEISAVEARGELERLLADSRFHVTERNRAFLRYIADAHLADPPVPVKAYTVAVDVFGRAGDFDSGTDPIVRIEATRLRTALDHYYEAFWRDATLRIRLPRGNYVTEFSRIEAVEDSERTDTEEDAHAPSDDALPVRVGVHPHRRELVLAAICGGAAIALAVGIAVQWPSDDGRLALDGVRKPLVALVMTTAAPEDAGQADRVEDRLLVGLYKFGSLRITTDPGPVENKADTGTMDFRREQSRYRIIMKYTLEGGRPSVFWRVVETGTGETVASGDEHASVEMPGADDGLADMLSMRFGPPAALLGVLELERPYPADAPGNICVLRAERAMTMLDVGAFASSKSCLGATLALDAANADAAATLSRLLVLQDELAGTADEIGRALVIGAQLVNGPSTAGDRVLMARMESLYAVGKLDAAFAAGRMAAARNPLNPEIAGALALRLYVSGQRQEGVRVAASIPPDAVAYSRGQGIVIVMEARRQRRFIDVLTTSDQMGAGDMLVDTLRIGAFLGMHDPAKATNALAKAKAMYPDFAARMGRTMRAMHFEPAIVSMLEGDIAKADELAMAN